MKNDRKVSLQSNLFEPGQTLGGRYQVISCLGRGGMGVVYHVTQVFLNKELALKTIESRGISDETMRRFQTEARTAFAVKHPNVVAIDDFGLLDDQTPFLVMELIRGETLAEILKRKTHLPVSEAIPMFIQICRGLAHAHQLGVVHRDIKPSNIMVLDDMEPGTEGSVKIVDFGIATFAPEDEERSLTHTTEIAGSPLYISPEQCSGMKVDFRSDIYSLGCVIFEALTGTPPFIGDTALSTMMKHKSQAPPTLKQASLGTTFSKELEQVVAMMLAKSPEQRYQSVNAVAKDLAATIRGEAIEKPTVAAILEVPNSIPKPLTLTRSIFFGAILLTTLMSATLAGFAAFEIKHIQMEKPIIQVIRDKADPKVNAEDSALIIDQAAVESLESRASYELAQRLRHAGPNGHISMHFATLDRKQMEMISKTKWINFLDLEQCTFNNKDLDLLAALPNLTQLCVRGCDFNDEGAAGLAKCKKLTLLSVGGTTLTDKGIAILCEHNTSLQVIDFNSIKVTDVGMKSLGTLKNLGRADLKGDKAITNEGLKYLRNCPIYEIALNDNPNIDDKALETLAQYPHLSKALLTNTNVTLRGLEKFCIKNPTLKEIYIEHCKRLTKRDIDILNSKTPDVIVHSEPEKPEIDTDQ
ncbi:MAG: protein kinase [Cyanobacteria bacterium SZAS-4]|nr:protein kinase [Cyanobacteria bacterium SZAS-4]